MQTTLIWTVGGTNKLINIIQDTVCSHLKFLTHIRAVQRFQPLPGSVVYTIGLMIVDFHFRELSRYLPLFLGKM